MSVTPIGRDRDPLGAALFAGNLISAADLHRAEEESTQRREPLGAVLLQLGLVDETDLVVTNALRLGHLYVELDEYPVDLTAVTRLPEAAARRLHALPIDWDEGRLVVAMANPSDVVARDDLKVLTGADIKPVVVTPGALAAAFGRVYRLEDPELVAGIDTDAPTVGGGAAPTTAAIDADVDAAPIVRLVNSIIGQGIADRASDIHIEPNESDVRVRYRIDGVLHDATRLPRSVLNGLLSRIKIMSDVDIAERRVPQDGRVTATLGGRRADLRVATLPTVHGEQVTIRILDRSAPLLSLEELGFLPEELDAFRSVLEHSGGTILVTGPTGSGKSTTLYAALAAVSDATRKVITVEDPVEFRLAGVTHVQVNNRAGLTFAAALRSILRSDPDIVLIGEIRDRETAAIAMEAALTGHLVLSTLHTNDAPSAPVRLVEMGVEPFLVATALDGIVAQRLARRLCSRCRAEEAVTPAAAAVFAGAGLEPPATVGAPVGCQACSRTGFRGRVAVVEVLRVSETIEAMIAEGARADRLRDAALQEGMRTLVQVGLNHVAHGETTVEEVLRVSN